MDQPLAEVRLQFVTVAAGMATSQGVNGADREVPETVGPSLVPHVGHEPVVGEGQDRRIGPVRREFQQGGGFAAAGDGIHLEDRILGLDDGVLFVGEGHSGATGIQAWATVGAQRHVPDSLGVGRDGAAPELH